MTNTELRIRQQHYVQTGILFAFISMWSAIVVTYLFEKPQSLHDSFSPSQELFPQPELLVENEVTNENQLPLKRKLTMSSSEVAVPYPIYWNQQEQN